MTIQASQTKLDLVSMLSDFQDGSANFFRIDRGTRISVDDDEMWYVVDLPQGKAAVQYF